MNWSNAQNLNYLIVQSTAPKNSFSPTNGKTYPLGTTIENSKIVYVGTGTQTKIENLQNGTTYFFALYEVDVTLHYTLISQSSVTPLSRLKRPSTFSINTDNASLSLTWASGGDQKGFMLVRSTKKTVTFVPAMGTSYTLGQDLGEDQSVVYVGNDLNFVDSPLNNGTRYYYSLFAFSSAYAYSEGYTNHRTPQKNVLHLPTLSATPLDEAITLSWTQGNSGPAGVLLFRRVVMNPKAPPVAITNGRSYQTGGLSDNGEHIVVYRGSADSFTDTGLPNKLTQYYTLFLYYSDGSFSKNTAGVSAMPVATASGGNSGGTSSGSTGGSNGGGTSGGGSSSSGGTNGGTVGGQCSVTTLTNKIPQTLGAHPGDSFYYEGISKNFKLSLSAGLSLVLNSTDTKGDYGLGTPGLRFAIDSRFKKNSANDATLSSGEGNEAYFQTTSCSPITWSSRNLVLSRNTLVEKNNTLVETSYRGGFESEYSKLADGTFALVSIKDRNSNTATITRNTLGHIENISDSLTGQSIVISYANGKASSLTIACGPQYIFEYDIAGRLSKITYPDATNILLEYGEGTSLVTAVTDNLGAKSQYRYYSDGTLKTTVNPYNYLTTYTYNSTQVISSGFSTKVTDTYNSNGALIKRVENGVTSFFGRDDLNQLTSFTDHLGQLTAFTYGANQLLSSIQDPSGIYTGIVRDKNGNITRTVTSGPGGANLIFTYTYDNDNRLLSESGSEGTTTYSYDSSGNMTSLSQDGRTVMQASYSKGLPTNITDAFGITTQLTYDSQANLTSLRNVWGTVSQKSNTCGQMVTRQAAGISSSFSYDDMGRQTSESYVGSTGKSWSSQTEYTVTEGNQASYVRKNSVLRAFAGFGDSSNETGTGNPSTKNVSAVTQTSTGETNASTVGEVGHTETVNGMKTFECEGCKRQSSPTGN